MSDSLLLLVVVTAAAAADAFFPSVASATGPDDTEMVRTFIVMSLSSSDKSAHANEPPLSTNDVVKATAANTAAGDAFIVTDIDFRASAAMRAGRTNPCAAPHNRTRRRYTAATAVMIFLRDDDEYATTTTTEDLRLKTDD